MPGPRSRGMNSTRSLARASVTSVCGGPGPAHRLDALTTELSRPRSASWACARAFWPWYARRTASHVRRPQSPSSYGSHIAARGWPGSRATRLRGAVTGASRRPRAFGAGEGIQAERRRSYGLVDLRIAGRNRFASRARATLATAERFVVCVGRACARIRGRADQGSGPARDQGGVDSSTPGRIPREILAGEQANQVAEFVAEEAGK
jgi:hypothetical protein